MKALFFPAYNGTDINIYKLAYAVQVDDDDREQTDPPSGTVAVEVSCLVVGATVMFISGWM